MSKFAAAKWQVGQVYTYSFLHAKPPKSKTPTLWFVIFEIKKKKKKTSKANSKTAKLQILQKERKELANAKMIWL